MGEIAMMEADRKWVTEQLQKLPTPLLRQQTLEGYKKAFKEAYDAEPLPHRKDGKARFAANNRLREYIVKIELILKGNQ